MLLLSLLGWRWSYPWRKQMRLATLAAVWLPLPYLLSHAGALSGPRLPLDGVLICLSAFAVGCILPIASRPLRHGPEKEPPEKEPPKKEDREARRTPTY
jgi:hypothetical protein